MYIVGGHLHNFNISIPKHGSLGMRLLSVVEIGI